MLLTIYLHEYFIDEKCVVESLMATLQSPRIFGTKLVTPQTNRFITYDDTNCDMSSINLSWLSCLYSLVVKMRAFLILYFSVKLKRFHHPIARRHHDHGRHKSFITQIHNHRTFSSLPTMAARVSSPARSKLSSRHLTAGS